MATPFSCSKCGASASADLPQGMCGRCLFQLAIDLPSQQLEAIDQDTAGSMHPGPIATSQPTPKILRYFGDYEVISEIARGGMGVVYKARQISLNRLVAIKMLLPELVHNDERLRRFRIEAEAAASLQHPSIVAIHEIGEHRGHHYFSMAYVVGQDLAKLSGGNPQPADLAARYVQRIAEAIHHAHQRGVLHRDLKPANVLIDAQGEPQITDFGLAKLLRDRNDLTMTGQMLGTPGFMAPEQADGKNKELTTACDIYGLGALLYYLLTGRPPFKENSIERTLLAVLSMDPRSPRELVPSIPRDLETISLRCLSKDPKDRYASSKDVAEELERFLCRHPIKARPSTTIQRLRLWCARKPAMAVLGGGTILLLLTILIGSPIAILRINRARQLAEESRQHEQRERQRAEDALNQIQLQESEDLFESGDTSTALACLARILRREPSNRVAAERLLSALTYRSFILPRIEPLKEQASGSPTNGITQEPGITSSKSYGLTNDYLLSLIRERDQEEAVSISPDGNWVVIPSDPSTCWVWNVRTGKQAAGPFKHEGRVLSAQFSQDGRIVVTGSSDTKARIWDAQTGRPLLGPLKHGGTVSSARFSPDGQQILTVSAYQVLRLWDAKTGRPTTGPLKLEKLASSAQFSPDGRQVITSYFDRSIQVCDVKIGQHWSEPLKHEHRVWAVEFSPNGKWVVTASYDETARIWDAKTALPVTGPLQHGGVLSSAHFSPDSKRVVTASEDQTARIWDTQSGKPLTAPIEHDSGVWSAQFSPDGSKIVTTCRAYSLGGYARIWDAKTGEPLTEPLMHRAGVSIAQFSPDGQRIVTASEDHTARIWEAKTGRPLSDPLKHEAWVRFAEFSPDGKWLLTASEDQTARLWDAITGLPLLPPFKHEDKVGMAHFSRDGNRIVTASGDGTARIWDSRTGVPLTKPLRHEGWLCSAHFSPDGLRVVTASADNTARIWDAQTGKPLTEPFRHDKEVLSASFSPDGHQIVTGSRDRSAKLWETPSVPLPVSDLVSRLAEAIGGKRFNAQGICETVPAADLEDVARQLLSQPTGDVWTQWIKWFYADPKVRTLSPFSTKTTAD